MHRHPADGHAAGLGAGRGQGAVRVCTGAGARCEAGVGARPWAWAMPLGWTARAAHHLPLRTGGDLPLVALRQHKVRGPGEVAGPLGGSPGLPVDGVHPAATTLPVPPSQGPGGPQHPTDLRPGTRPSAGASAGPVAPIHIPCSPHQQRRVEPWLACRQGASPAGRGVWVPRGPSGPTGSRGRVPCTLGGGGWCTAPVPGAAGTTPPLLLRGINHSTVAVAASLR